MRWLTAPALALFLATASFAEDPPAATQPGPVDDFFTRWDANKDGIVTTDECESTRLFSKNDKDGDGQITRAEVEAAWKAEEGTETITEPKTTGTDPGRQNPKRGGVGLPDPGRQSGGSGMTDDQNRMRVRRIFNRFDKNGDDLLDATEAAAYYFEVLDGDRDGALMQSELAANPKVGPEKAAMTIQYFDKDGDGAIFPGEWSLPEDGTFRRVDANSDGKVSFDEALIGFLPAPTGGNTVAQGAGRGLNVDDFLKQNDADGDGKVSEAEWKGPKQLFGRGDSNQDGFMDRAEIEEAAKKLSKMGGAGMPGQAGKGGGKDLAAMVKRADQDGDGKVTRDEWPGRPQMFDRMDKNGDGLLDEADFGDGSMGGTDNAPPQPPVKDEDDGMKDGEGEGSGK